MYKFWNDALLRREVDLHLLRQASGRHWSYPGPQWMLAASLWVVPALALVAWTGPYAESVLLVAAVWQTWLLGLRAIISCSVSVAEEVEKKTLVVLHTTPVGLGRLLLTKLGVCIWPLFVEVYFLGIFYQALNWAHNWTSWQNLLQLEVLQVSVTLLYGCLGLWLGGIIGSSEKAAASARVTAVLTMIGFAILARQDAPMTWPLLLALVMIFFGLMVAPQSRVSRTYQSGVLASVFLLLFTGTWGWISNLPNFEVFHYSPLQAVGQHGGQMNISLLYLTLASFCLWLSYRQVVKTD